MSATLFRTATEYTANSLTFTRGTVEDVVSVGVYHNVDPGVIPETTDFTTVQIVSPGDPLAEGNNIDVLALIGPRNGDVDLEIPGTYQRWVLVQTDTEDIIRRPDTVTIL